MRWFILMLSLALLTGCTQGAIGTHKTDVKAGHNNQSKQKELTAFEDIPANADTKLDPEKSIIINEGDQWLGRLVLKTDMNPFNTFEYFRDHMPELGWNLVASVKSQNAVLTYMKGLRVATVQISSSGYDSSKVSITVSNSSGVAPKKVK